MGNHERKSLMIIRKLKQMEYEKLNKALIERAHAEPLEACYTVNMQIDGVSYAMKIQPERHCRMAILQAYRIDREEDGPNFELITRGNLLSALLETLIYQGVR